MLFRGGKKGIDMSTEKPGKFSLKWYLCQNLKNWGMDWRSQEKSVLQREQSNEIGELFQIIFRGDTAAADWARLWLVEELSEVMEVEWNRLLGA